MLKRVLDKSLDKSATHSQPFTMKMIKMDPVTKYIALRFTED